MHDAALTRPLEQRVQVAQNSRDARILELFVATCEEIGERRQIDARGDDAELLFTEPLASLHRQEAAMRRPSKQVRGRRQVTKRVPFVTLGSARRDHDYRLAPLTR